jgi:hypothetical protein
MSIIKEKIRLTGNDLNIKFPITNTGEFTGYQQEIDSFTTVKTVDSINDTVDGEVKRFKLEDSQFLRKIYFAFFIDGSNPEQWNDNFQYAGFTTEEVASLSADYLNSFFILDFFDTFDPKIQTKFFSAYLTKLYSNNVFSNPIFSGYEFNESFQYYNQHVPLDQLATDGDSYTGYSRFSFYNAKSGTTAVFYNRDNRYDTSAEKMFVKTVLDLNTMTFMFDTPSNLTTNPYVYLHELVSSPQYIEKYNDTFENFDNLQQIYPTGSTFNYETGGYENVD